MDLCLGWLIFFSISRMLNNEVYSFLSFIFKFQKWRISLFYEVPYIASIFFTFYFVSFYCCPGLYFGFIDFCGCWKIFLDFHPENAFQFWNWHIFLDFLVNFCLFFLLISSFLDFSAVFFVKNQLIWQLSLIIHLLNASFYPDVFLFYKIVHMLVRFWYFFQTFMFCSNFGFDY